MSRKYRIFVIICIFISILFASCKTIQTTGTQHIDTILDSNILDSDKPLTRPQKQRIKATLIEAKQEIISGKESEEKYRKLAEGNAKLARQAKIFWGVLSGFSALGLGLFAWKLWKKAT